MQIILPGASHNHLSCHCHRYRRRRTISSRNRLCLLGPGRAIYIRLPRRLYRFRHRKWICIPPARDSGLRTQLLSSGWKILSIKFTGISSSSIPNISRNCYQLIGSHLRATCSCRKSRKPNSRSSFLYFILRISPSPRLPPSKAGPPFLRSATNT